MGYFAKITEREPRIALGESEMGRGVTNGGIFAPLGAKMAVFVTNGAFPLPLRTPGAAERAS